MKTGYQEPLSVSEPTESPSSMADWLQASRAAWRSAAATRAAWRSVAAARHWRPAQRGQGRQTRATSLPATARTQPRMPFTSPRLPSSPAAAAASAPSAVVAITDASLPSPLLHHHSCSTSTPETRLLPPCPLTVLGKLQHRAQARRSLTAESIVVAMPSQSTIPHDSLCARFA